MKVRKVRYAIWSKMKWFPFQKQLIDLVLKQITGDSTATIQRPKIWALDGAQFIHILPFPVKVQNYKGVGEKEGEEPPPRRKNINCRQSQGPYFCSLQHCSLFSVAENPWKKTKDNNLLVLVGKRLWVSAVLHGSPFLDKNYAMGR